MKKKLTLFFTLLAFCVSGAWAQVYTISSGNGTFYDSKDVVNNEWASKFKSTNQKLTVTFAQGFGVASTELYAPTDASEGTYTISVTGLAKIASYSIAGTTSGDLSFTPNGGSAQTVTNGNAANWSADVNASSTSFKLQGGHITGVTFTVTVVPVPDGVYQIDLHANNVSYSKYLMAEVALSGQVADNTSAPSNGHYVFKRVADTNNDYTIQDITSGKYVYAKEADNLNATTYYRGNNSNPLGVNNLPSKESDDYNKYIWTIQSKVPTSGSQKNGGEYNIISKYKNTLCLALWAGSDSYYSLYNDFTYDGSKARLTSATLASLLGTYTVAQLRNAFTLDEIKTAASYSNYVLTSEQQEEHLDKTGFPTTAAYTQFVADFTDSGAKTPQAAVEALLNSTLPSSGYYYIKNKGQSTYMFRDEEWNSYGANMTLLNTESRTPKYIWKVDVDGTTVNVTSLTGKSITHGRSATTDTDMAITSAWQTGLTSAYGSYYMGYLQDPNQNGGYTAKGSGNYNSTDNPRVVTYYSAAGGDINNTKAYWVFEDVDESDYDVYSVSFVNSPGDNYVTYSGSATTGNKKVYDGGYYFMTKDASVSASDFTGESVTNCSSVITIEGKAITVTYTNWKTTIDNYIASNDVWTHLANAGKVGYPANTPANTGDLNTAKDIITGGTYSEDVYNGLVTAFTTYKSLSVITPSTGKFYRFKAAKSSKYLKGESSTDGHFLNTTEQDGAKSIFYFDSSTHLLSYYSGQYAYYTSYIAPVGTETVGTYVFENPKTYFGALSVKTSPKMGDFGVYLYSHTDTKTYANQQGSKADETDWYIEEVTSLPITMHEVDGAYYGTINLPVAVEIPDGLSAYSATASGDEMTLTKVVEDGVLAANTPVILYSKSNVASLTISNETGSSAVGSELSGTTAAISVTANQNYVLNSVNDNVGFYLFNGTVMPGFKAYLTSANASVRAFTFSFEDAEDAIRAIESENSGLEIYDISGRRVQKAQKGLYIVNGKKVMYK